MFAGLRIVKAETKDKKKEKKEKRKDKEKGKSKQKDGKKHKKRKKEKNKSSDSGIASSESSGSSSAHAGAQGSKAPGADASDAGNARGDAGHSEWMVPDSSAGEGDFFSSLGTERSRGQKLKPDPDKHKVSEREYNPFLRGEESNLPTPESAGKLPRSVCVGDGGLGWRKRAQMRAQQTARQASEGGEASKGDPAAAGGRPDSGGGALTSQGRGSLGGGWRDRARARSRSRSAGRRDEAKRPVQARGAPDDADRVMERMQAKYGSSAKRAASAPPAAAEAKPEASKAEEEEPEDANALGAQAMQAMLSGDMALYEKLNKRLEAVQAKMASASQADAAKGGAGGAAKPRSDVQRVKVLEEVDAAGRSRALLEGVQTASVHTKGRQKRGQANAIPGKGANLSGFYEDDNVSLEDLVRRERIQGQQDYDSNFAKHIMKKGSKFKMLDEDEDEAYALGWYEDASKKLDAQRRGDRSRRQEMAEKERIQVNLSQCTRCMESKRFGRRDAIMSVAQHTYLCVEGFNQSILPGQVFIAPMEHLPATTDLDEEVYREIRNYQKCLVRFFEAEEPPRAVIFAESAVHRVSRDKALMGAGPHAVVTAYPVELGLLQEARAYWRKAFDEAECEFTVQHRKVIETDAKGGVRRAIPKGFAYVHADFSLGGGYAHVVEDTQEFPRDFAQQTIAGMCQLTVLDRAYTSREAYRVACNETIARFRKGGFDWAAALRA